MRKVPDHLFQYPTKSDGLVYRNDKWLIYQLDYYNSQDEQLIFDFLDVMIEMVVRHNPEDPKTRKDFLLKVREISNNLIELAKQ